MQSPRLGGLGMDLRVTGEREAEMADQAQEYEEAVAGIRRGYEAVKAGQTRPAIELMNELRAKYGL